MPRVGRHQELKAARHTVLDVASQIAHLYKQGDPSGACAMVASRLIGAVDLFELIGADLDARGGANTRATSINAATTTLPSKGTVRYNIILTLVAHWATYRTGMTIAELKARLRKEHSTVSAALNYVVESGWVRATDETRLTQHQKPAIVWAPTERAIEIVRGQAVA